MSAPGIAVLHHLERPFTGHAGAVLSGAGVMLDERDVRRGDRPPELSEVDGILSLGGEQSVLDIDRVVDALRRDDRARSASPGGR